MELYQILAVVNPETAPGMENIYRSSGTKVGISQIAAGTAKNDVLVRYGLAKTEKRIVGTIASGPQLRTIFSKARNLLYMDIPGNGILLAIPIKSVVGRQALAFLTDAEMTGGKPKMDFEYELIVMIVKEGYVDLAMDAAREAGAGGGTVLHAKGTGGERGKEFFSVRFADEKDMIYIVVHRDEKAAVMQAVHEKAGPNTEAQGICFSMPISAVMGLRARSTESVETGNDTGGVS